MYYGLSLLLLLDCIIPFVLAHFYEGYSHQTMLLSVLGNESSPVHKIYRLWMGILGVGIVWASFNLFHDWQNVSKGWSIVLLGAMLSYGIFDCIFSCFFEIGETKEMLTIAAKLHGVGSVIGSTLFLFCGICIGNLLIKSGNIGLGRSCFMVFILTIFIFGLFIASDKPELKETIGNYEGIWQRLSYALMYIPFMIITFCKQ